MTNKFQLLLIVGFIFCFASISNAQVASGGTFTLEQKSISSGGRSAGAGNIFIVEGSVGQSAAGTRMTGGAFTQIGGFWTPLPSAPTAAMVRLSGRVVRDNDIGVDKVTVTLLGGQMTSPRTVLTNPFGYFEFEDVEAGFSYVISVQHKTYSFDQSNQSISVVADETEIIFHAIPQP